MKRNLTHSILGLALLGALAATPVAAATYDIDTSHSEVGFQIKHLAISKVKGSFGDFAGTFDFTPGDPASWSCEATIQATSVDTGNAKRDEHLRSPDFFAVAEFPTITFKSTGVKMKNAEEGTLTGDLTMHGVTKPVELALVLNGAVADPWGNQRAGFSASGEIDRREFGLTWSKVLESGGLVVDDMVKLTIEVEGIQQK